MTHIYAILGPTATGKSEVALALAEKHDLPVVSVDSMQVYRGLDIGTAKPSRAEQARVRHHMIDLVDPEFSYSVAEFQETARQVLAREERVLIVGGSGLHFRAIVDPLEFPPTDPEVRADVEAMADPVAVLVGADPDAGQAVDLQNRRRVVRALEILHLTGQSPSARLRGRNREAVGQYQSLLEFKAVGLDSGESLGTLIHQRVDKMRSAGWWEEAARIRPRLGPTAGAALGYRELLEAQAGRRPAENVWLDIKSATRALARRQRTYFRRDPRIDWLPWEGELTARTSAVEARLGIE